MAQNAPLISVIVPVYKVEHYLRKCVDSVVAQTYTNLEIILVNDGSPDNCGKICDEYAENEERAKVIHKSNGGTSDARNTGLDVARGNFIAFIDSDDFVSTNYIEYLYDLITKYDADISICNYLPVREDGVVIKSRNSLIKDKFYQKEYFKLLFSAMLYEENIAIYDSPCIKLYKKDLFTNVRFPKGKLFEDVRTIPKLFHKAEKIIFGKEKHYFYQIRQNSATTKKFSCNTFELIEATKEMCQFVGNNYEGLEKACARRYVSAMFCVLRRLVETDNYDKKEACLLRKKILLNSRGLLFASKVPARDKFALFTLFFGVRVFSMCWNIYKRITNRK